MGRNRLGQTRRSAPTATTADTGRGAPRCAPDEGGEQGANAHPRARSDLTPPLKCRKLRYYGSKVKHHADSCWPVKSDAFPWKWETPATHPGEPAGWGGY